MEGYVDIHSHLLYGMDDGSKNIEQTRSMVRIAYEEGIRSIIATPHYHYNFNNKSIEEIDEIFHKQKEEIEKTWPEMKLYLGNEIFYSHDSVKLLNEKQIKTMADSMYVLVEFSPQADYRYIKNGLHELVLEGYCPILAHVERYPSVVKDLSIVEEFIEMGVYIQVNAMSITGGTMGRVYQRITRKLLKKGCVHFIATDSHSDKVRAPRLKKCVEYITKKYGQAYARELLYENQKKILCNEYL
ncbi:MAG: hypothetical protein GX913_04130 [Clostridiales bacterium]|nr:hypothetical protein [Clostridiales bacterium]